MRTLILGLGNPILRDDAIGLHVVRALRPVLAGRDGIDLEEDSHGGLRLMERMIGYDRAIILDAIITGAEPGTVHVMASLDAPTQHCASTHDVNLPTALALGRQAGVPLPSDGNILLVGIEAADILSFGEECTPAVRAAIAPAVREVLEALDRLSGGTPR